MDLHTIKTPSLVLDIARVRRNAERMSERVREFGVSLRPHVKTHKTPEVARMQLERGALGLTVAKVGEAEVMIASGIVAETDEVLIAYPILGGEKARRLAALARTIRILVSLDSPEAAKGLSHVARAEGVKFGVLVEFDSGFGRCGLGTGPDCVALAKAIEKLPNLSFRGLMTFFGNVWGSEEQRRKEMRDSAGRIEKILDCFASERINVEVVSGNINLTKFEEKNNNSIDGEVMRRLSTGGGAKAL